MTLTIEELKYGAEVGDLGIDAVRAVCAEALANREAQPVAVGKFAGWGLYHATDDRFSSWIHPQPRDQSYLDSLKPGYANIKLFTAPPAPAVPDAIITAPIEAMRCGPAASYVLGWNACRAAMLEAAPEGGN